MSVIPMLYLQLYSLFCIVSSPNSNISSFMIDLAILIENETFGIQSCLCYGYSLLKFKNTITVFDAVQSTLCLGPPVNLEESRSLKKFSTKNLWKNYAFELTVNKIFLFLFFLFKYDEIIIKQPSSRTFCIKVANF